MIADIEPELMGIYNTGVRGNGGGGGGSGSGAAIAFTLPEASTSAAGVVKTCNSSSSEVTSETESIVPTMWYVQNAIAQLTGGTYTIPDGGTQGTVDIASAGTSETGKAGIIKPSSDYFTVAQNGYTTINAATTQKAGVVTTCNSSSDQVTSETVAIVPTQYFVQTEVTRLEQAISSAGGAPGTSSAWTSFTDLGSAASATFEAGGAYKLDAMEGQHELTAITSGGNLIGAPATVQLLVSDPANITISGALILKDEFTANARNIYTISFIDGMAYMTKVLTVDGYVVTETTGTSGKVLNGTLHYALITSGIASATFSPLTNNSICYVSGASAANDDPKLLIGNGVSYTSVGGSLGGSCTMSALMFTDGNFTGGRLVMSSAGIANVLNKNGEVVFGSGLTVLSGAYVTSGLTVLENGAIISGSGTINGTNSRHLEVSSTRSVSITGATIEHCHAVSGGCVNIAYKGSFYAENCTFQSSFANSGTAIYLAGTNSNVVLSNCVIDGNSGGKGTIALTNTCTVKLYGCSITNNYCSEGGGAIWTQGSTNSVYLSDCLISSGTLMLNGQVRMILAGSNTFGTGGNTKMCSAAICYISSGAVIDCTGNAGNNGDIISCGSGVIIGYDDNDTWVQGGTATVINSAGTAVTIEGSGTKLKKDGTLS